MDNCLCTSFIWSNIWFTLLIFIFQICHLYVPKRFKNTQKLFKYTPHTLQTVSKISKNISNIALICFKTFQIYPWKGYFWKKLKRKKGSFNSTLPRGVNLKIENFSGIRRKLPQVFNIRKSYCFRTGTTIKLDYKNIYL